MKKKTVKYLAQCRKCWTEIRYMVEFEDTEDIPKRIEKTCICQKPISLRIEKKKKGIK